MTPPPPDPSPSGPPPARLREAERFIRAHLPLREVPGTGLRLHLAGPRSGLSRLVPPGGTPYWAHAWPGGVALALHLAAQPGALRPEGGPLPVVEVGAGGGVASLAAARAGAAATALDPDPLALAALRLNARANGLRVGARRAGLRDLPAAAPKPPFLLLAGDLFYDESLAAEAEAAFDALPPGAHILVGDIGRRFLPRHRLEPLAPYPVRDVGDAPSAAPRQGWVFRWTRP